MKRGLLGICALLGMAALLVAGIGMTPALADGVNLYARVGGSIAKIEKLSTDNTDNIGYFGEIGLAGDTFAVGIEASRHMHDGNETLGAAVNGYVYFTDWVVRPYGTGGIGATFEGDPLAQAGGGFMWVANKEASGSFNLFAEYKIRCYPDDWDSFDCASNDNTFNVGGLVTF